MVKKSLWWFVLSLVLSGCGLIYRVDVQQGNLITQEMVAQLKTGMPEQKVRYIMGNPLLTSIFHQFPTKQRWDYFYSLRKGWHEVENRKLTLVIDNGVLAEIGGDTTQLPTQQETEQMSPAFKEKPLL